MSPAAPLGQLREWIVQRLDPLEDRDPVDGAPTASITKGRR